MMNFNLTLIGQIGTFLVFWWFVYKVVWPIFKRVADERQNKIAEGLSLADKAKVTMADAEVKYKKTLAEARTQANEIVARANKQATQMVETAKDDAKKAGDLEIEQARSQIEHEARQAKDDLKSQVSTLVIDGVEKIVAREINAKDHEQLLSELSEKL